MASRNPRPMRPRRYSPTPYLIRIITGEVTAFWSRTSLFLMHHLRNRDQKFPLRYRHRPRWILCFWGKDKSSGASGGATVEVQPQPRKAAYQWVACKAVALALERKKVKAVTWTMTSVIWVIGIGLILVNTCHVLTIPSFCCYLPRALARMVLVIDYNLANRNSRTPWA